MSEQGIASISAAGLSSYIVDAICTAEGINSAQAVC